MKVAFVYGPMSIGGRPLDFSRLYDDQRGMTGSELSCVEYARALGRRGHDVTLFVCQGEAPGLDWEGIRVELGMSKRALLADDHSNPPWDAICAWNEPDLLRHVDPNAVRLVNQQLNDFTYCQPGFTDYVDVFTSPSAHHMAFIAPQAPGTFKPDDLESDKWCVLPNGCDPTLYTDGKRVPGRVLWASSPDRGLHLLLQAWPRIRERVPHATLHALYNFAPGPMLEYEEGSIGLNGLPVTPDIQELAQRYRYIRYATERLKDHGVVQVGSCSRNEVVREMNEAVVLGYPCDTIRYTEGFSVTTMEACAAGLVPVISSEDALGSIYEGCAAIIPSPVSNKLDLFVSTVVAGLTDKEREWQDFVRVNCRDLAARHAWPLLAERLEQILMAEREKKTVRAWQSAAGPVDPVAHDDVLGNISALRKYAETRYGGVK